jgi:hypothetical protein
MPSGDLLISLGCSPSPGGSPDLWNHHLGPKITKSVGLYQLAGKLLIP